MFEKLFTEIKIYFFLVFLVGVTIFLFFTVNVADAISCPSPPPGGNYTVSTTCSFSRNVNGVDGGNLTVNSGVTLTISSGPPPQTIVFNSGRSITVNGSIAIASGAKIRKTNLWMVDGDGDGWPLTLSQTAGDATPPDSERRMDMQNDALTDTDCNDSIYEIANKCVTCDPGTWINTSCGASSCATTDDMGQIRYWNWSDGSGSCGLISETRCVASASCPPAGPSCDPSGWSNTSCGASPCATTDDMGQIQYWNLSDGSGACGLISETRCVASASCPSSYFCPTICSNWYSFSRVSSWWDDEPSCSYSSHESITRWQDNSCPGNKCWNGICNDTPPDYENASNCSSDCAVASKGTIWRCVCDEGGPIEAYKCGIPPASACTGTPPFGCYSAFFKWGTLQSYCSPSCNNSGCS